MSFSSFSGEYEGSLGAGHEYGGVLGWQSAYKTEHSKFYGSVGLVGFAVGFQTTFSENSKHAYGVSVGAEAINSDEGFLFATYNYHFNGFSNDGLVIGTGFGYTKGDGVNINWYGCADCKKEEKEANFTLSIGYKF
jgi:hypothetical protein